MNTGTTQTAEGNRASGFSLGQSVRFLLSYEKRFLTGLIESLGHNGGWVSVSRDVSGPLLAPRRVWVLFREMEAVK